MKRPGWGAFGLAAVAAATPAPTLAATLVVDPTGATSAYTTITAALDAASSGDTVTVLAGSYAESLTVDTDVLLEGAGSGSTTLSGVTTVTVNEGITATIRGFTLVPTSRGMITAGGTIALDDIVITGVTSSVNGVGVRATGTGSLTITNSVFQSLDAGAYAGAAIYATGSSVTVGSSTFDGNSSGYGGAIYVSGGSLSVTRSTFTSNACGSNGGAIYASGAVLAVDGSSFTANLASSGIAGAVYATGDAVFTATTFDDNEAYTGAGAVFSSANLTLTGTDFTANQERSGAGYGGAVWQYGGDLQLADSAFVGNDASSGGAIRVDETATATIVRSSFEANTADYGGAVRLASSGDVALDTCTFTSNVATWEGGGVRWVPAFGGAPGLLVDTCVFTENTGSAGGGVYGESAGTFTVLDSHFEGNAAGDGGALGLTSVAGVEAVRNEWCVNEATGAGGAVYQSSVGTGDLDGSVRWLNNTFTENTAAVGGALYHSVDYAPILQNNDFLGSTGTTLGGALYFVDDGAELTNNVVGWTSAGLAIEATGAGSFTLGYNDFFGNTAGDLGSSLSLGAGNLTDDPTLRSYTADGVCDNDNLAPEFGSPLVDAGDPALLDPDGGRSDVGVYGGADADLDGFVDGDLDGYTTLVDCDDTTPAINPLATEIAYNSVDEDCSGADLCDADGDGEDAPAPACLGADCDDDDAAVYPSAAEVWYDGVDQDCSGGSDYDQDGDGDWSTAFWGSDCDDTDPAVNGWLEEVWYDGVDQDCDGNDDDRDEDGFAAAEAGGDDCEDRDPRLNPGAAELCADGLDNDCSGEVDDKDEDGDGHVDEACGAYIGALPADDCDDGVATTFPGAPEVPYDGVDNNCDHGDEDDVDRDGYLAAEIGGSDCVDTDPTIHPNADDAVGDGIDQDCDGEDAEASEIDSAGDTGAATEPECGCAAGPGGGGVMVVLLAGLVALRRPAQVRHARSSAQPVHR